MASLTCIGRLGLQDGAQRALVRISLLRLLCLAGRRLPASAIAGSDCEHSDGQPCSQTNIDKLHGRPGPLPGGSTDLQCEASRATAVARCSR